MQRRYALRYAVIAGLGLCGLVVLPFDVPLASFFLADRLPGELRSLIHKTEFFGHIYGILGITLTIYLLDESKRRYLPRLLSVATAAGLACDVVKVFFHRIRPCDFSFGAGESTFLGLSFFHVESVHEIYQSSFHSFPSAHTATAVAFAMTLGCIYPKAARWFLVLAALVAVSRFEGGAHYVSDTCIGAIVGYVVACQFLAQGSVGSWFDRWEAMSGFPILRLPVLSRCARRAV